MDFSLSFSLVLVITQNQKEDIGGSEITDGYTHTKPAFPASHVLFSHTQAC